ncbi:DHA2 family efflux MFS transporter permease subunit [Arcanobacterium hippocoleae]
MQITKEQKRMVGVLILAAFVTILNQTVVNPAIPSVMRDMHVGAATTQWLVSGFTLVNSILVPVTAYFSDRFPVRGLYIFSVASFILGSALCGWAVNFPMLLTGRITQAIGAGILMPLTMTVMMLVFPIEKRGTAMGFFGLVISFAPAIGPTVSGIVIDAASWRWLFRGIFVLALIILAASGFVTNKTAGGRKNQRLDIPSVILSTLGFGGVLYVLSSVTGTPLSWIELAVALVGIISLVSFFLRQLRLETPLLQIRVLKIRSFTISTIIGMLVQASLMSGVVLIPIYVQQMRGMPATVSGLLLLPGALLSAVINPIAGRFSIETARGVLPSAVQSHSHSPVFSSVSSTKTPRFCLSVPYSRFG